MDELDSSNVHAARRLRHKEQFRRQPEFSSDDQFLLITSRERSSRQCTIRRPDVKIANDSIGVLLNSFFVEQYAVILHGRFPTVNSKNRVLFQIEVQQQTTTVTILRNMRDAEF